MTQCSKKHCCYCSCGCCCCCCCCCYCGCCCFCQMPREASDESTRQNPLVIKKEGGRRPPSKMTRVNSDTEGRIRIRSYPSHSGRWPSATFLFNYKCVLLCALVRCCSCHLTETTTTATTTTAVITTTTTTGTIGDYKNGRVQE